ncbi:hypothetical protein K435DRAFT_868422 [Dendrothele bispora CBS 962.96]|uniref:CxC2-like cysteine cluster KDZ transposase-associated domain-containing protein n=1 Tax=Dendrothele bispora (strain CBS 962.96) TaxID=1314807 RepID=A0A4S8LBP1_DENBC|nr:hypothetical protein K435DRAFT_868422 [Dendrothele bispora CBS 962.96]
MPDTPVKAVRGHLTQSTSTPLLPNSPGGRRGILSRVPITPNKSRESSLSSPDHKRRRVDSEPVSPPVEVVRGKIGSTSERAHRDADKSTGTQNDYNRQYEEKRGAMLQCRVNCMAPDKFQCNDCGAQMCASAYMYQCRDCHGEKMQCQACCIKSHTQLPFHRLKVWVSERLYREGTLGDQELGFILNMGHSGEACGTPEGESNVLFGDVNGFFTLRVRWCGCDNSEGKERWQQLLRMGYMPASFTRPQTAFSTRLFDRVHLEMMEGHCSLKAAYEVLKRITDPNRPERVDNRYVEFMRVYRWHRDLTWTLEGGGFHDPTLCKVPGGLALFCTCCPQPGINVFSVKEGDPPWVYRIYVTIDGNFKLEQLMQRNGEMEVRLRDGKGFLVGIDKYMEFLDKTQDWVQPRSTCNDFYNQNNTDKSVDHLMWRGLVSLACARHGCFFPNASMNMKSGEQQRIADFGLSQMLLWVIDVLNKADISDAAKIRTVTIIYDIMCQYKVKLHERLAKGGLTVPSELQLQYMIGKFHLGGHKEDCWAMYTLDLLFGSGRQDGEVLETLWAGLNKSKSTVRAMSGAFRQEFLDDLMQDSNWKKLIDADNMLLTRWKRAEFNENACGITFMDISSRINEDDKNAWDEEARLVEETRDPTRLKIYEIVKTKGKTFTEVKEHLALEEMQGKANTGGDVGFLCRGLALELSAVRLKKIIREKDNKPTLIEAYELAGELKRLMQNYNSFQEEAVLRIQRVIGQSKLPTLRDATGRKEDINWSLYTDEDDMAQICDPESLVLYLPSNMSVIDRGRVGWEEMARQEVELREGTVRETLTELRLQLGQRVMRYKALRGEKNQKDSGRMFQGLKKQMEKVRGIAEAYRTEVRALEQLQGQSVVAKKWKGIKESDFAVTTEERTTRTKLAWFWSDVNISVDQELEENPQMENFYKVNYLRAKARWDRWKEEKVLVKKEMEWRVAWFDHAQEVWMEREMSADLSKGAKVYAAVQAEKWRMFAWRSRLAFGLLI